MCVNRGSEYGPGGRGCQGDTSLAELSRPPSVLVNETGDILYVRDRTVRYLEPASGEARMNIFTIAREGGQKAEETIGSWGFPNAVSRRTGNWRPLGDSSVEERSITCEDGSL